MIAQTTQIRKVYGLEPPTLLTYEVGSSIFFEVEKNLEERDTMLVELWQHLHKAQQRM